ncbi:hypothetical protein F4780DRAFT_215809 [Xylariomycetidae sp. FL0641]|nr:hypothetical protein F4780DRAFT_215809 [Xylariomycetidae sp. FL0641]
MAIHAPLSIPPFIYSVTPCLFFAIPIAFASAGQLPRFRSTWRPESERPSHSPGLTSTLRTVSSAPSRTLRRSTMPSISRVFFELCLKHETLGLAVRGGPVYWKLVSDEWTVLEYLEPGEVKSIVDAYVQARQRHAGARPKFDTSIVHRASRRPCHRFANPHSSVASRCRAHSRHPTERLRPVQPADGRPQHRSP